MEDVFSSFQWHSAVGIDRTLTGNAVFRTRLACTPHNLARFVQAGDNLLIHRATKALWQKSEDGKSIVPVFGSSILTDEDLELLEREDEEDSP